MPLSKARALLPMVLAGACTESPPAPPPEERALVDAEAWEPASAAVDLFAELRPADATCDPELGYGLDMLGGAPSFEINTGRCNYLTITQPTLEAITAGDPLGVHLWHFELTSMEPDAEAYAAVAVGGQVIWETTIAIPSSSGLVVEEWEAPADAPAGTTIQFHLNNHGINSWDLLSISVTH